MTDVDPRLAAALSAQLGHMRAALDSGAHRIGWKVGAGDRERIGPGPVVGHLTSATLLRPGATYDAEGIVALHADAEVYVQLARDVADGDDVAGAIGGYGAALELVDLGPPDHAAAIVTTNVFHRAVAFGPLHASLPHERVEGRLVVNGVQRDAATDEQHHEAPIRAIARPPAAGGGQVRAGDRIITGSVVQIPPEPGDEVRADLGILGSVSARIAAH